jgi:hypothetical protein
MWRPSSRPHHLKVQPRPKSTTVETMLLLHGPLWGHSKSELYHLVKIYYIAEHVVRTQQMIAMYCWTEVVTLTWLRRYSVVCMGFILLPTFSCLPCLGDIRNFISSDAWEHRIFFLSSWPLHMFSLPEIFAVPPIYQACLCLRGFCFYWLLPLPGRIILRSLLVSVPLSTQVSVQMLSPECSLPWPPYVK